MNSDSLSLKLECLLRRLGLAGVSRGALLCIVFVCVLLLVFALWRFWPASSSTSEDFEVTTDSETVEQASSDASGEGGAAGEADGASTDIYVDVEGAVANPGVYVLPAGSRVNDAVEMAGGLTEKASRQSVNLAEQLEDGVQVYVPTKKEAESGAVSSGSSSTSTAGSTSSEEETTMININTATSEELEELSGIGPTLSQNIVDYREENGEFTSIEEIKEVSGIGDGRFAAIEDCICV